MKLAVKKWLAAALVSSLAVTALAGCGGDGSEETAGAAGSEASIAALSEALPGVEDTSDLPNWNGKELNLRLWLAHGSGGLPRRVSENDVVTPEIKRVTGVTFDAENSFDNGGDVIDVRLGKVTVAKDYPDMIVIPDKAKFVEMAEAGLFWDLSPYLEKYCPNIMEKALNTEVFPNIMNDVKVSAGQEGKAYGLPFKPNYDILTALNPDFDFSEFKEPSSELPFVWVRDDILRMIYPEAKTQQEIEDIYMERGEFTKEEILDVPINSKEEFIDFLYKIDNLHVMEGNQEVETFYTHNGGDNWTLMAQFGGLFGWHVDYTRTDCNYFSYFDKETQRVEMMYQQPFFKEAVKTYNQLVRDGVASKEALVDNPTVFQQKVSNGMYAVLYSMSDADQSFAALKAANKPFAYRKVFLNIRQNKDKFAFTENVDPNARVGDCIALFKDKVAEEDIPQILTMIDYLMSDAGQKLQIWGPESAGLFTVDEQGRRIYTDKELENDIVYNANNERQLYYNVGGSTAAWPGYLGTELNLNLFKPTKNNYPVERQRSEANKAFNYGRVEPFQFEPNCNPGYANLLGQVPEFDKFWSARQAFESALKKVFAASDDEQFEKLYSELLDIAESSGMTEEAIEAIDKYYKETINPDYTEFLQ